MVHISISRRISGSIAHAASSSCSLTSVASSWGKCRNGACRNAVAAHRLSPYARNASNGERLAISFQSDETNRAEDRQAEMSLLVVPDSRTINIKLFGSHNRSLYGTENNLLGENAAYQRRKFVRRRN